MAGFIVIKHFIERKLDILRYIIMKHPEVICLFAALLFSLGNKICVSKISKKIERSAPPPRRFFTHYASSRVLDYEYGQLNYIRSILNQDGLVAVMFYAPWCSYSKRGRIEYEMAAKYFSNQVKFAAVNCWYPAGQCRLTNSFTEFPTMYFYHQKLDGFKYTGPFKAEHMIAFIEKLLYPVTYIKTNKDYRLLKAKYERAVIGYFDAEGLSSQNYQQFYYAAMRMIEDNPSSIIPFGIITSYSEAQQLNLNTSGQIVFSQYGQEDMVYPSSVNLTSSGITSWLRKIPTKASILWSHPTGSKSLHLSSSIDNKPAILLFLPYYPLSTQIQPAMDIKVLSRCPLENIQEENDYRTDIHLLHNETSKAIMSLQEKCKALRKEIRKQENNDNHCCVSLLFNSFKCELCSVNFAKICSFKIWERNDRVLSLSAKNQSNFCQSFGNVFYDRKRYSICCHGNHIHKQHKPDTFYDTNLKTICRKLVFSNANRWLPRDKIELSQTLPENVLESEHCEGNKSVQVVGMDNRGIGTFFAQSLGVHSNKGAVLFDTKTEMQHVHEGPVTGNIIGNIIKNYSSSTLPKYYMTSNESQLCKDSFCIQEVTSATFDNVVMDQTKDVVLLYYTPWCGFCRSFSHIFLSLAHYFRSSKRILFARINGDKNELPWQYQVNSYPSVLFFPANRKTDSVTFPMSLKFRVVNLLRFILTHAAPELKLETAISACTHICITANTKETAKKIQHIITQKINMEKKYKRAKEYALNNLTLNTNDQENWTEYLNFLKLRLTELQNNEQHARKLHYRLRSSKVPYLEKRLFTTFS